MVQTEQQKEKTSEKQLQVKSNHSAKSVEANLYISFFHSTPLKLNQPKIRYKIIAKNVASKIQMRKTVTGEKNLCS